MDTREIRIRQVDPIEEQGRILAVLARNLPTAAAAERLAWLYLSNPDGPALVWLAEDQKGEPVGTSAAHPRRIRIEGTVVRALVLGDFAVDTAYRALGPALRLVRATLAPVFEKAYALSYDFPNTSMYAVYRRMGWKDVGRNESWIRPVALTPLAKRKLGDGIVAGVVGAAGDAILRGYTALTRGSGGGVEVTPLVGECDEEFDALDGRLAQRWPVIGVRDAAYLNWRYLRHTMWDHTILCARENRRLVGYAVLRQETPEAVGLVDLHAEENGKVRRRLVSEAVRWAGSRGAAALRVEVQSGSDTARMVKSLGFFRRSHHLGLVPFFDLKSPYATALAMPGNWWLMGGDRDV